MPEQNDLLNALKGTTATTVPNVSGGFGQGFAPMYIALKERKRAEKKAEKETEAKNLHELMLERTKREETMRQSMATQLDTFFGNIAGTTKPGMTGSEEWKTQRSLISAKAGTQRAETSAGVRKQALDAAATARGAKENEKSASWTAIELGRDIRNLRERQDDAKLGLAEWTADDNVYLAAKNKRYNALLEIPKVKEILGYMQGLEAGQTPTKPKTWDELQKQFGR